MINRFLIAILLSWPIISFAEVKIGIVDMQKAMLQTSDGQRAKRTLEEEFKKRQEVRQRMETGMRKLSEEFERKVKLLAHDAKEKRKLELQSEMRRFQEAVAKNQTEMEKRQKELLDPIVEKLSQIAADLARKENYTLVISRPDQLILFATKESDLTARVVEEYGKS